MIIIRQLTDKELAALINELEIAGLKNYNHQLQRNRTIYSIAKELLVLRMKYKGLLAKHNEKDEDFNQS